MEYKDYYKILGVARDTDQPIKQAYRRLARKHHPDVSKAKGSADRFKEINEAYEVLSDPEKRNRCSIGYTSDAGRVQGGPTRSRPADRACSGSAGGGTG